MNAREGNDASSDACPPVTAKAQRGQADAENRPVSYTASSSGTSLSHSTGTTISVTSGSSETARSRMSWLTSGWSSRAWLSSPVGAGNCVVAGQAALQCVPPATGIYRRSILANFDSLARRVDRPCLNQDRLDIGTSASLCDGQRS